MAYKASDGKSFTNRAPMKAHERSIGRMAQHSEAGGVATEHEQPEMQDESEMHGKPVHTLHHEDGTHTTVHEDGYEQHHASAEELHQHLKKHMPEKEHEMEHGDSEEPEYE